MYTSITTDSGDVAILMLAVENVFKKLIRLLVGKISLKTLQEMVQVIFVEKAEAHTENTKIGMAAVGNLVDTIGHNLTAPKENEESFYQRDC